MNGAVLLERQLICPLEADTARVGGLLAKSLTAPAFIALFGGLGAGKTVFTRGFGEALGAADVASPSFMIVREHDSEPRLLHFDAYRLSGAEELAAVGFDDYLRQRALIVLEWAERVPELLPPERLDIHIEGSGQEERRLRLVARGARYAEAVAAL